MPLGTSLSRGALVLWAAFALLGGPAHAATTYVSMEFDDGYADQAQAAQMLVAHKMRGTFYVNSARLGKAGRLSYAQVQDLQAAGHEIGGHTLHHLHLASLDEATARTEICADRTALLTHGLAADHLAYPFGETNDAVKAIVAGCEYLSGRLASGLVSGMACQGCPFSVSLPPADPYAIRIPDSVRETTPLEQIEGYVTQAEQHGGGWVQILMHHVCDGCDVYGVSPDTFQAFLDWLQPKMGTALHVRTPAQLLDRSGPTVATSTPDAGSSGTGTVTITAAPEAPAGTRRVRFFADGKQLGTRTNSPWRWKWDTSKVARGAHKLMVLLEDAAGNAAASKTIRFTVG